MFFCSKATAPKVVIDIGTFCWLSARFCAVTVISSSCPPVAGAVSASAQTGPMMAAMMVQIRYPLAIPIVIPPIGFFIVCSATQEYRVAGFDPKFGLISCDAAIRNAKVLAEGLNLQKYTLTIAGRTL